MVPFLKRSIANRESVPCHCITNFLFSFSTAFNDPLLSVTPFIEITRSANGNSAKNFNC